MPFLTRKENAPKPSHDDIDMMWKEVRALSVAQSVLARDLVHASQRDDNQEAVEQHMTALRLISDKLMYYNVAFYEADYAHNH